MPTLADFKTLRLSPFPANGLQNHAAEGGDFAGIHGTGSGFERWVDASALSVL